MARVLWIAAAAFLVALVAAQSDIVVDTNGSFDNMKPSKSGDYEWYGYCGTDPGPSDPEQLWDCMTANVDTRSNRDSATAPNCHCGDEKPFHPDAREWRDFELDRPNNFPIQLRWGRPLCFGNSNACSSSANLRPSGVGFRPVENVVIPRSNPGQLTRFGRFVHFNYVIQAAHATEWDFDMQIGLTINGVRQVSTFNFRMAMLETRNWCTWSNKGTYEDGCQTSRYWIDNPDALEWPACTQTDPDDPPLGRLEPDNDLQCCPFRTLQDNTGSNERPCSDRVRFLNAISVSSDPFIIDGLEYTVFLDGFVVPDTNPPVPKDFFISEERRRTELELYGHLVLNCPDASCPPGVDTVISNGACVCECPATQCPTGAVVSDVCACECPADCGSCGTSQVVNGACVCVPDTNCCPAPQEVTCDGTDTSACECTCPTNSCGPGQLIIDEAPCTACECPSTSTTPCPVANEVYDSTAACACVCPLAPATCTDAGCQFDAATCACTDCPRPCDAVCNVATECYTSSCPTDGSANCVEVYNGGAACGGGNKCFQQCVDNEADCQAVDNHLCADKIAELETELGSNSASCFSYECVPETGDCDVTFVEGPCTSVDLETIFGQYDAACYTAACVPTGDNTGECRATFDTTNSLCTPDPADIPAGLSADDAQCWRGECTGAKCEAVFTEGAPCTLSTGSAAELGLDDQCYVATCTASSNGCELVARADEPCNDGNPCTFEQGTTTTEGSRADKCVYYEGASELTCRGSSSPCVDELLASGELGPEQLNDTCIENIECVFDSNTGLRFCENPCAIVLASSSSSSSTGALIGGIIGGLAAATIFFCLAFIAFGFFVLGAAKYTGLIGDGAGAMNTNTAVDNPMYADDGAKENAAYE